MKRKSLYTLHKEQWLGCDRCLLHEHRRNVVLCRGKLPCDVLFVGEAPGESEDVLGSPFVGPAGQLLDGLIEDALEDTLVESDGVGGKRFVRLAFTNLVGCIPHNEDMNKYEVPKVAIKECRPRLVDICKIARPQLVVCVGVLSAKNWTVKMWDDAFNKPAKIPGNKYKRKNPPRFVTIPHPAAILRANEADRGLMEQRCVVTLGDAAESLFGGGD